MRFSIDCHVLRSSLYMESKTCTMEKFTTYIYEKHSGFREAKYFLSLEDKKHVKMYVFVTMATRYRILFTKF